MDAAPEEQTVWLEDAAGNAIGVTPVQRQGMPLVLLTVPALGYSREIDAKAASRLLENLRTGLAFTELTGDRTFGVNLGDI